MTYLNGHWDHNFSRYRAWQKQDEAKKIAEEKKAQQKQNNQHVELERIQKNLEAAGFYVWLLIKIL
jgi:hypothetical protein